MTDYDQAGRYLIKCDAAGFCRWLLARADASLLELIEKYGLRHRFPDARIFPNLSDAISAFRAETAAVP